MRRARPPGLARAPLLLGLLSAAGVGALLLALLAGSVPLGLDALWQTLGGHADPTTRAVLLELRLPRALNALAVGGSLALAGALLQVLLHNPLADPYVLGVSGGAASGALLAVVAGFGGAAMGGAAWIGALAAIILVFTFGRSGGSWAPTRLLLTGVVLAAGWGALINLLLAVAPQQDLRGMLFWLMGDLSHSRDPLPTLLLLGVALAATLPLARSLNLLARGELLAASLGVAPAGLRLHIYLTAALLTAAAVASGGSIGFVGLVVPHLLRLAVGSSDHRLLLPAAALGGGTLLLLADTLARTVVAPQQLPVGVVTALIGVPLFLLLLARGPARP